MTDSPYVLVMSARTEEALGQIRRQLAAYLALHSPDLADVAATLHRGRERLHVRSVVVAGSVAEAVDLLNAEPGAQHRGLAPRDPQPVAVTPAGPGPMTLDKLGIRPDALRVGPDGLVLDAADSRTHAELAARLWLAGHEPDVTLGRPGRRLRLPGYPFERVTADDLGSDSSPSPNTRPLTPLEQRRLFHDLVRGGEGVEYNRTAVGSVPVAVERDRAQAAFAALQQRHPELRTVLEENGGRWQARVLPTSTVPIVFVDDASAAAAQRAFRHDGHPYVSCAAVVGTDDTVVALTVYEPMALTNPVERLHQELCSLLAEPVPVPEGM